LNNDFYFSILNIGSNKDVKEVIDDTLKMVHNQYEDNGISIEGMCKVFTNIISSILTDNRIDNRILNLKDEYGLYEHEVVLCRGIHQGEVKYFLIDFTYPQFCGKYPYNAINKDKRGVIIADKLLKDRYVLVNNDDINMYIKSFGNISSSFNLDEYFNDLDKKRNKK